MNSSDSAITRPCPYCAESIKCEAIKCRFCQHPVTVSLLYKGAQFPISEKELHQIALKFVASKKTLLSYQELKAVFSTKNPPTPPFIASDISYSDAQQLQQLAIACRLNVVLQETRSSETTSLPSQDNAPTAQQRVWRLQGYHLLLVLCIIVGGWYLMRVSRTPAPTLPKTTQESTASKNTTALPVNVDNANVAVEKPANIQEALIRATVTIIDNNAVGSGFFVHPGGYLITNVHVIEKMPSPQVVLENGEKFSASFVRAEKSLDIAVLKINSRQSVPYLTIGDATATKRGETVWTVGSPHGLSFTLTKGIISFVGRNVNGIAYLQTDAAINGGNSGGPMINEQGQVIGINTFIIKDAEGLGFALPINYLYMSSRALLQDIVTTVYPNDLMQQWYGFANQPQTTVASFAQPKNPPGNTDSFADQQNYNSQNTTIETLNRLIKESQDMDTVYSQVQTKLNNEISSVALEKQTLEQKYFNGNMSLSITQETQLGKRLKEININLTNRQIALYEKAADYLKAKEVNIKATLQHAGAAPQLQAQLQNLLIDVKSQIDKNQQSLSSKRQELATLKSQAY